MSRALRLGVPGALLVALVLAPLPAAGDPAPRLATEQVDDRVIVRWEPAVPAARRHAVLARHLGAVEVTELSARVSVVASGNRTPTGVAAALMDEPAVQAAEPDRVVAVGDPPLALATAPADMPPVTDPLLDSQWGLRNTGRTVGLDGLFQGVRGIDARVFPAWEVTRGEPSVRVAVIDTALDATHPDLRGAILEELRVSEATAGSRAHGTGVASILAARADDRWGMAGVAPEVSLLSIVAFGAIEDGQPILGMLSDVVGALELAVAADVDVINASWVTAAGGEVLEAVIAEAGVPVVTAAGNDGVVLSDEVVTYPASLDLPNLLTVTAIDPAGQVPPFANTGVTSVDIAAPGEAVLVAAPGGVHAWERGTSAAVPFVTGAVALAASAAPYATTDELVDAVIWTSRPLPALTDTTASGGMLDAGALVRGVQRPVCRRDQLPSAPFDDVAETNRHRTGIDCVVAAGLAQGRSPDRFAPDVEVTRGQLASMLAGLVVREFPLPEPTASPFRDVPDTHTHARAIWAMHALGVLGGRDDGRYLPDAPVTRGQATALSVRTYELLTGDRLPPSRRWFGDTGTTTFGDRIDRARDLGMVRGVDRVVFGPGQFLRRGQTATLLARTVDAVARHGEVEGGAQG